MSLQEEARRRAEALRAKCRVPSYDDSDSDDEKDALFAAANALSTPSSSASTWRRDSWHDNRTKQHPMFMHDSLKLAATQSTSPSSSPDTQSSVNLNDQATPPTTTTCSRQQTTPHSNVAAQARRDWQNHGTSLTQALEDVRLYHHDLPSVRVFATAAKVDAAGQDYTAYLIRVEQPSPKNEATIVEHRFSDFYKLSQELEGIPIPVAFPSRMNLFGRLGNWTPSQLLAPEHHQSLIQYRLKQLDAWLVHVVKMLTQLEPKLQECIYRFLEADTIVPCQQPLRMSQHPKSSFSISAATESLSWNNPVTFTMGSALRQACRSIETLCHLPQNNGLVPLGAMPEADHTIPLDLLRVARGILFVTVVKAGWVVSGRIGTGLLVQRLNSLDESAEWSAPTAIGTFGVGWGILAGADVTHYMVIFTSDSAVRDLVQQSATLQVGAELSAAMGPLGRSANSHLQTGDWTMHTAYAYAHSQGLFMGVSLEGSLWQVRGDVNAKFYGQRNIEATHLLHQPGPVGAQPLYDRLDLALSQQSQLAGSSSWLPSPPPRSAAKSASLFSPRI
uniref:PX domain-containing protein n=1 Tax=Amphora coffeiformis TaxID=265554 RepID=A0A7S3L598_9STRA|mmetsp:Transcript_8422/g.16084  ORF Transcript_8422/g.16084 Transcript_8422/m.16084 type:complete len:560 (+) Transcript_8422:216-1895(+)|eukprot:scaffold4833_cov233-Amphora_coffeaeformis.AAC.27